MDSESHSKEMDGVLQIRVALLEINISPDLETDTWTRELLHGHQLSREGWLRPGQRSESCHSDKTHNTHNKGPEEVRTKTF